MKRTNLLIFSSVLLLLFFADNSYCFDLENKISKTKLQNGLTVLIMERHASPTVSLYIRHRVGAVDETEGETGAAHLLEHMMFKGTTSIGTTNYKAEKIILQEIEKTGNALDREKSKGKKADSRRLQILAAKLKQLETKHKKYFVPNAIDRLYTENGGLDMNASTGQDITTYQVSLPSNKIELWARIESDRLMNPVFREFYTERSVVMEERRQRVETDPQGKLYEHFLSTTYKYHPYRRPIIGWADDLMNLTPAAVRKIFAKYKSAGNIVIAAVGDINTAATLKLINKYFGALPPGSSVKDKAIPAEPQQREERRITVNFDANPQIFIGYHKPTVPVYEDYVFDVIETILTKGRTSRMYNNLVTEAGIAKSINAANGIPGNRYNNIFLITAEPRYPHTNKELTEAIFSEIERLKTEPVSADELAKAKNHLRMGYIKSLDSNSELASILSYYEVLLGNYKYFADYPKVIEQVSVNDVQNTAKLYFGQDNRTVADLRKGQD